MAKAGQAYFSAEFFRFFNELSRNNDRAWFAKNKARYEEVVQAPALRFIADAGLKLRSLSQQIVVEPKPFGGSLSRIYRDTRFSKDKSPYHTHIGIHFGHQAAGDGDAHLPGFFLHLGPGESAAYCGVWRPDPPALKAIREAIVEKPDAWKKAMKGAGAFEGESLKRPPPGFDPNHPLVDALKQKDFTGAAPFPDAEVASPKFLDAFLARCRSMNGLNSFLADAMGVEW